MARDHVGEQPFVVLLGDDLMHEKSGILAGMLAAYERMGSSILALKKVKSAAEVSLYGCVAGEPAGESLFRVRDVVEKPTPEEAPSDLGVMGRYVLTPGDIRCHRAHRPGPEAVRIQPRPTPLLCWPRAKPFTVTPLSTAASTSATSWTT